VGLSPSADLLLFLAALLLLLTEDFLMAPVEEWPFVRLLELLAALPEALLLVLLELAWAFV